MSKSRTHFSARFKRTGFGYLWYAYRNNKMVAQGAAFSLSDAKEAVRIVRREDDTFWGGV